MNEELKSTRVGTIELALELKGLPAILAGMEQIKVAAQEAAAAVASIGAPKAASSSTPSPAEALAAEWASEMQSGVNAYGMPPRTAAEFIAALPKPEAE